MMTKGFRRRIIYNMLFLMGFSFYGCDAIYRILQREGAEEKDLLGVVVPREFNETVAKAQKLLKLYGYKVGSIDGALGANTRSAIKAFQSDNGLKPSRFIDYATWDVLTFFERQGLLVDGELNISALQQVLKAAGYDPGRIDGNPGHKTQSALKSFQQAEGLVPDGKIGIQTLKALSKYLPQQSE